MTRLELRLLSFGAAAVLTRGTVMGSLPESDFGVWPPLP